LYQNASKRDIQHIRPFAQSAHATIHSELTQPLMFLLIVPYRARVPQSESSAYVTRPEWGSQVDISNVKKKEQTRMERHIRKEAERKKNAKVKRAVEISINGGKMTL
jgi:hypothetical protein